MWDRVLSCPRVHGDFEQPIPKLHEKSLVCDKSQLKLNDTELKLLYMGTVRITMSIITQQTASYQDEGDFPSYCIMVTAANSCS